MSKPSHRKADNEAMATLDITYREAIRNVQRIYCNVAADDVDRREMIRAVERIFDTMTRPSRMLTLTDIEDATRRLRKIADQS